MEGIREGKINSCNKCVDNAALNDSICFCNNDSFSKDSYFCYKCDDNLQGNPGCVLSEGCEYFSVDDHLNCGKCKEGFVQYTQGQCFSCNSFIPNCNECHYNKANDKIICDSCINSIYFLNSENNQCELNECEEYPDISPGCIICKDKLDEFKQNNKCQRCKNGYFKTKEEKCVYCNSEERGGHACTECQYEKNDEGTDMENIICKSCFPTYSLFYNSSKESDTFLSKEGKCYDCEILFNNNCEKCSITKDSDGKESLKCISCIDGYFLTNEGNCVSFINILTKIENCQFIDYTFGDIEIGIRKGYYEDYYISQIYSIYKDAYEIFGNKLISSGMEGIEIKCSQCINLYFLNNEGKCEETSFDKCSFNLILKNYKLLKSPCWDFCYYKVSIFLKLGNDKDLSIDNLDYNYYNEYFEIFGEDSNIKACLSNSGYGGEYSPINLKNCMKAYYFPENNTYICFSCIYGYYLDNDQLCHKEEKSCIVENKGTEILPNYQCYDYNKGKYLNFTLVINENGDKEFIEAIKDLEGCVQAFANTTYINSKYNCTKCSFMYIPYYNKFFDRIICQNIKAKIIRENSISYDIFKEATDKVKATNGICDKDYLFTPDGEYCYK